MKKIDITTTATIRPGVLDRTLTSFRQKLFKNVPCRLIINVDPIGIAKKRPDDVIYIAKKHFADVVYNIPEKPSFPKAWIWCWKQVTADWVFHLEEDWLLMRPVNINHMIGILENNPTIAALRMAKMKITNLNFFSSRYIQKDGFLLAMNRKKSFGGNPQLIRGDFVKQAREYMIEDRNPEKQFRAGTPVVYENVVKHWDYAVYGRVGDPMLVQDIGTSWKKHNGFVKKGGAGFLEWEKIK